MSLVYCNICGKVYNSDSVEDSSHNFYHTTHNDLVIPKHISNYIRGIIEANLLKQSREHSTNEDTIEKNLVAMVHLWYNDEPNRFNSIDDAIVFYKKQLKIRYGNFSSIIDEIF